MLTLRLPRRSMVTLRRLSNGSPREKCCALWRIGWAQRRPGRSMRPTLIRAAAHRPRALRRRRAVRRPSAFTSARSGTRSGWRWWGATWMRSGGLACPSTTCSTQWISSTARTCAPSCALSIRSAASRSASTASKGRTLGRASAQRTRGRSHRSSWRRRGRCRPNSSAISTPPAPRPPP